MSLYLWHFVGHTSDSFSESSLGKATFYCNIAQEGGCDAFGGMFSGIGSPLFP